MRIAYDEQAFQIQRYGGVSRYVARLARELAGHGDRVAVFAPFHGNAHLAAAAGFARYGVRVPGFRFGPQRLLWGFNRLVTRFAIPAWKPDVVHETYYTRTPLAGRRLPTVVTVHDMITELYPDTHRHADRFIHVKRAAIGRADHVICASENTRLDLCRILNVPPEKTSVVHLGCDWPGTGDPVHAAPEPGSRPFLLVVGQRSGYKNFLGLLDALGSSRWLMKDHDLVLFGGPPLSAAEYRTAAFCGLPADRLRHVRGGDEMLSRLYTQAVALVYPSLYEGFGLPPLEAMAWGCPVVCSNRGSLPEVVGDAAYLFDPASRDDMRSAIEAVVGSEERQVVLRHAGRQRARRFTWQRCAAQTRTAYERAISCSIQSSNETLSDVLRS
jgi:glycosyltransferase involved in cell wall biosynthesis